MKHKFKFSLRAMLVVIAVFAAISAVLMNLRNNELRRQVLASDDNVPERAVSLQPYSSSGKSFSAPLHRITGSRLVGGPNDTLIDSVNFKAGATSEEIDEVIGLFPEITRVHIHFSVASIENISMLRELTLLEHVQVNDGTISTLEVNEMGRLAQRPEVSFQNIHLDDKLLSDAVKSGIRLQYVYSPTSAVTDSGLESVAKLDSLISLLLDGCPVSDKGVSVLANHPALRYIHLKNCRVGDSVVATLKTIPNLYQLSLKGTDLTDEGAKMLVPIAGSLAEIDIRDTGVTDAGVAMLKPPCRLGALKHSP